MEPLKSKPPLFEFAYFGRMEHVLSKLENMAMFESWEYSKSPNKGPFPILFNYLNHTFLRLKEQGKIVVKDHISCFNTGLVTANQQEIFALFVQGENRLDFHEFCNDGFSLIGGPLSIGYVTPKGELYENFQKKNLFLTTKEDMLANFYDKTNRVYRSPQDSISYKIALREFLKLHFK